MGRLSSGELSKIVQRTRQVCSMGEEIRGGLRPREVPGDPFHQEEKSDGGPPVYGDHWKPGCGESTVTESPRRVARPVSILERPYKESCCERRIGVQLHGKDNSISMGTVSTKIEVDLYGRRQAYHDVWEPGMGGQTRSGNLDDEQPQSSHCGTE